MKAKQSTRQIVCFGEIMMRLAPFDYLRFGQNDQLELTYGGAEANVAIAAAQLGMDTAFVTKLPDNPIAQGCINMVRSFGVNCEGIVRGGERIGIY
ncbi:MAG: PfkB family carbohydrate kinase, partial [Clostridia bacterium]|nr:PfkB family carbohydrate kinase [Clostridia bacterium]